MSIDSGIPGPRTAVALVMTEGQNVLVGRRRNRPETGCWQLPGGWIRYGEHPIQAVARQLAMFGAVKTGEPEFVTFTNNQFVSGEHSISLYFSVQVLNAAMLDLSVNSDCEQWQWALPDSLPLPLFTPLARLTELKQFSEIFS